MGNQNLEQDATGFEAIWQRVMDDHTADVAVHGAVSEEERLRKFMDDEASDAEYYRRWATRSSQHCAQIFKKIAADERRHLRQLQVEYFILTGDTYMPLQSVDESKSILCALRKKYKDERRGAASYQAAAEADPSRTALYSDLAADELLHSKRLMKIIYNMLS
jgi:rubrerythrin